MNRIQQSLARLTIAAAMGLGLAAPSLYAQEKATQEQVAKVNDLSSVFRTIGHQIEPSVVNILVHKTAKNAELSARPKLDDEMLKKFFPDRDGDGKPDIPPGLIPDPDDDGAFEQMGTGSGVIIEVDGSTGYIVTNNHVAGGATEMVITLSDGREIKNGKVLGADPKTDLAVIKVEAPDLKAAPWGDSSQMDRGDWIMAFGSPFGYVGSMTHGIISALNRDRVGILGQGGYENFIQVDAPINPGNSGGPLVNTKGEVIGINTAIASRSGGFQGIGFAIPSNQAKTIYKQLKETGKVVRGWLGVAIRDVAADLDMARSFGYEDKNGVLVNQTFPNTPATGKLKNGDIITGINGKPVKNVTELRNQIAATAPNEEVKLTVFRDKKKEDVTIKLGEQPEDVMAFSGRPDRAGGAAKADKSSFETLGMKLESLNDDLKQKYPQLSDEKAGAVVVNVDPKSRSAKAGFRPGDLITEVGTKKVTSVKDVSDAIKEAGPGNGIRFYVTTSEGSMFRFIPGESK